ncbi:MAG: heme lyase CcmF/NrfE family subunit [Rubrivivax sp.]|nr:heme lyase CcmF/NrfE family subunit [Rubrivivax sp.]
MIPELGHLLLYFALGVSLVQGVLPLVGAHRDHRGWMLLARPLSYLQGLLVTAAFALLAFSFLRNDFSVLYVASNSNSALPKWYQFAAVWGGHEGSLLLWVLMLSGWTVAVARYSHKLPLAFASRILGVMGLVAVGFLLFMLLTSNPFDRLLPAAADGRDLNPLLQDPGMVIHPPMLYMGYVGFSVAFAFAIAALLGGNLDATWARWTRPWTTAAWVFLTFGIGLGSWWAYNELGWGGWWFWDPVENASFMPWLTGTALIHSLAVSEKRGSFKVWTVWLAIMAFSLSLLGTFLVRSGVLSSVHAFATDPRRGLFILAFLVIVIGASLVLFAWRAPTVGLGQRFSLLSRESLLLGNNMMLAAATGAVLLGTLYPLFLDALGMGKISVGPPYFDTVFALLMAPLVLVMGIGPLTRWKQDEAGVLARRLALPLVLSLVAALAVGWSAGKIQATTTGGLMMAFWIVFTLAADLKPRLLPAGGSLGQILHRAGQIPVAMWGMMLAHLGVAAFAFGVAMVNTFQEERDVKMGPGDSTEIVGYRFEMKSLRQVQGPNYVAMEGTMTITRDGRLVDTLNPQKRIYRVQQNPMTEAAVNANLWRDLYVSMGEQLPSGEWVVRVQYKPFISWIWGGCLIMMAGGLLAMSDRRYRQKQNAGARAGALQERAA